MTITYDPMLVMLSIVIPITGALTGMAVIVGYDKPGKRSYAPALIKGAVIIGGSIWSMHFISMLALRLPVMVNYSVVETMLSLFIAVVGAGVALHLVSRRRVGWASVPISGMLMGAAIGGMHYLGMHAMQGCGIIYLEAGIITSLAIGVAASTIALWFTFRKRGTAETLLGGLMLGLTIASVHYSAMISTGFDPLQVSFAGSVPLMSRDTLAFIIAASTLAICGVFLFLFSSLAFGAPARPTTGRR